MKSTFRKIGKTLLWVVSIFIGAIVIAIITYSFIYSPEYVLRALMWGDSDVYDYQKFPERVMEQGSEIFYFEEKLDEARINSMFETQPLIDEMESFIQGSDTDFFSEFFNFPRFPYFSKVHKQRGIAAT